MQTDTSHHEGHAPAPRAFTPALPFLRLYDLVVRFAAREDVWRAAALARLAPTDGDVLVDAGCGTGSFLARIGQTAPNATLVGVDPDNRILARARAKLERAGVIARLERGYLSDLDALLGSGTATKVTSTLVLHQVPLAEKRAGLAACHRLLAPGGTLVVADYGKQRTATMRTLFKLVQYVDGFTDTQPNADGILPELLRDAGFVDVEETDVFATATGSISIYRGTKPPSGAVVAANARDPEERRHDRGALHTLMRFREWATNDLYAVLAGCLERIAEPDRTIVLRLLDHIHTVEDIFRHNLERRPHTFRAPRSDSVPSFAALQNVSRAIGAWYVAYAAALSPQDLDEPIDFTYSNGDPARMTRGQMLLHVAMHSTGHRGSIGILLQKNGLQPNPDRLTDFLDAARR